MRTVLLLVLALLLTPTAMAANPALMKPVQAYVETGTDVDASAYNEVDASTDFTAAAVLVANGTDVPVKIATGAASSEVDLPMYIPNGEALVVNLPIPKGSRLSVRALGADASSGYVTITLLQ